jgi:thiamine pyrophosphokinase
LICNGEPPSRTRARKLAAAADFVVAADGGANIARRFGIWPHLIVGDLDSIAPATRKFFSPSPHRTKPRRSTEFLHVPRQDNTDLEKALDVLAERRTKRVVIIAATGRRIDHTLGNLSVIWRYTDAMEIVFVGDGWFALPVGKMKRLHAARGTIVSLIPFGACSGITLKGLQYPLREATMRVGEIGLSNVVVKSPFTVRVRNGNMLMIVHAHFPLSFE